MEMQTSEFSKCRRNVNIKRQIVIIRFFVNHGEIAV